MDKKEMVLVRMGFAIHKYHHIIQRRNYLVLPSYLESLVVFYPITTWQLPRLSLLTPFLLMEKMLNTPTAKILSVEAPI